MSQFLQYMNNKSCGVNIRDCGIIKVYIHKLFKLKNDEKKEYLCLLSICTAIK